VLVELISEIYYYFDIPTNNYHTVQWNGDIDRLFRHIAVMCSFYGIFKILIIIKL